MMSFRNEKELYAVLETKFFNVAIFDGTVKVYDVLDLKDESVVGAYYFDFEKGGIIY